MGISAIYSVVNVQFVYLGGQYPFDALINVFVYYIMQML